MGLNILKQMLYENGFLKKRTVFYKIVNDVLQNVEIEQCIVRKEFRITFGVSPLCARMTSVYQGCLYDLANLCHSDYASYHRGWYYGRPDICAKDDCIRSMNDCCQHYLFPLLRSADCCKSAFSIMQGVLKYADEVRRKALQSTGFTDEAPPFEMQCLLNQNLMFMALKNGDYDYASKSLKVILQKENRKYQCNVAHHLNEATLQRHAAVILQMQNLLHNIEQGSTSKVQELLTENEKHSRKCIQLDGRRSL